VLFKDIFLFFFTRQVSYSKAVFATNFVLTLVFNTIIMKYNIPKIVNQRIPVLECKIPILDTVKNA